MQLRGRPSDESMGLGDKPGDIDSGEAQWDDHPKTTGGKSVGCLMPVIDHIGRNLHLCLPSSDRSGCLADRIYMILYVLLSCIH